MKYLSTIALITFLVLTSAVSGATLKDKTITYDSGFMQGEVIPLGVDPYGYNYQAHSFAGSYFNAYANEGGFPPYLGDDATYLAENPTAANHWAWPYRNDQLAMKWNEAWLSNKDSDDNGTLDRHLGFPSYIGSGAWISNHMSGEYTNDGQNELWNYFVKIVAAPADAVKDGVVWRESSGTEIGPVIWGEFAEIQVVYNDSGTGDHGSLYRSPAGAGVGKY